MRYPSCVKIFIEDKLNFERFVSCNTKAVFLDNGKILSRQVESGTGQGNQNELTLHFGLGSHDKPIKVEILWPDGTILNMYNVAIDQKLIFNLNS